MTTTTKSSKLDKKLNAIKNTQKGKLNKNQEKGQIQSSKGQKGCEFLKLRQSHRNPTKKAQNFITNWMI